MFGYRPEGVTGKNFATIGVFRVRDLPGLVKLFKDTVVIIVFSTVFSIVMFDLQ